MKRVTWVVLALAGSAGPALAQVQAGFVAGAGNAQLAGGPVSGVLSLTPDLHFRSPRLRFDFAGTYSGHSSLGHGTAGRASIAANRQLAPAVRLEAEVTGGWTALSWLRPAGGWIGSGQLLFGDTNTANLYLGIGAGQAFSRGSQALTRMETGGWGSVGDFAFGFSLVRTGFSALQGTGGARSGSSGGVADTLPSPIGSGKILAEQYIDAGFSLGWTRDRFELETGLARRFGKPTTSYNSWHLKGAMRSRPNWRWSAASGATPPMRQGPQRELRHPVHAALRLSPLRAAGSSGPGAGASARGGGVRGSERRRRALHGVDADV